MGLAQSMGFHPQIAQQLRQRQYLLLTYRSGIISKQKTTYYTSDSGWGCMLRVGQMFIANLLRQKCKQMEKEEILKMFYDNQLREFSIQMMTKLSKEMFSYMKEYQWFTPCQCGFLIKEMMEKWSHQWKVKICNDGSMFLEDLVDNNQDDLKIVLEQIENIQNKATHFQQNNQSNHLNVNNKKTQQFNSQTQQNLVILLMARIGLDKPQLGYLKCITRFMQSKYFAGILGGTPKYAHLFLSQYKGYFGYLDPHTTQSTLSNINKISQHMQEYTAKLSWIKQTKIDTSMAVGFCLKRSQLSLFWKQMKELKQQLKDDFFVYIDIHKPEIDQNAIIEIGFDDQESDKQEQK